MSEPRTLSRFAYRASDNAGQILRGYVVAESHGAAHAALLSKGLLVSELQTSKWRSLSVNIGSRVPLRDWAAGLDALAEVLGTGIPLMVALRTLPALAPETWQGHVPALMRTVSDGKPLSAAFRAMGIPGVAIGLITTGEQSGRLAKGIRDAAVALEREFDQRNAIISALAYPACLLCVGAATVTLLLLYILPRMITMLADMGQTIPASALMLIKIGGFARHLLLPLTTVLVIVFGFSQAFVPKSVSRRFRQMIVHRIPVFGRFRREMLSSRLCMSLGAMVEEGIPASRALQIASEAIGDIQTEERLTRARKRVSGGESLTTALRSEQVVTHQTGLLISAGERAGTLGAMLSKAARMEAVRAEQSVRRMTRLLEPALVLCIGGAVMFVAAALLQTVYALSPTD